MEQRRPTERIPLIECIVASVRRSKKNRRGVSAQQLEDLENKEKLLVSMAKKANIMEVATRTFPCITDKFLCADPKCSCSLLMSTLAIWAKQTPEEKWFMEEVLSTYNKAIAEDSLEAWLHDQSSSLASRAKLLKTEYLTALANEVMAEVATAMVCTCKASKEEPSVIGHMHVDVFARDTRKQLGKGFGRPANVHFAVLDLTGMSQDIRHQLRKDVVFFGESGQVVFFRKIIPLNEHIFLGKTPTFVRCDSFDKIMAVTTVGDYLAQMKGILDTTRLDRNFLALLKGEQKPEAPPVCVPVHNVEDLNEKQAKAARTCLSTSLCLVHGPPGTGKSTVMASIAAQPNPFVVRLMVSPTNRAVEAFVEKCLQKNLRVLVLGCEEQLTGVSMQHSVGKKRAEDERFQWVEAAYRDGWWDYRRFKDELHYLIIELIEEHDVVCGTVKAACNAFWTNKPYHLLVDEAGCLVEEWMPSLITLTNRQKVYVEAISLFGDEKQLSPYSMLIDANVESVLARLSRKPIIPGVALEVQYRMPWMVQQLVSNRFYHGQLRYGRAEFVKGKVEIHKHTHAPQRASDSHSLCNDLEVDMISKIITPLKDTTDEVCVITFYKAQVEILRKLLVSHQNVTVSTVDAVQGLECDVVVLSLVNDNTENLFVSKGNRINVAISRCKQSLILIGHATHFDPDGAWHFMQDLEGASTRPPTSAEPEEDMEVVVDPAWWESLDTHRVGSWADADDE